MFFNLTLLTQEKEIRGRIADEFNERFPHGLREVCPRTDDVTQRVDGEEEADPADLQPLEDHVHLPEPGQTLVPHRGQ